MQSVSVAKCEFIVALVKELQRRWKCGSVDALDRAASIAERTRPFRKDETAVDYADFLCSQS